MKILDVGQCGFDGPRMARLWREALEAEVQCADTGEEAAELLADQHFDLVLVNRVLAADRSSGLEVIERLCQSCWSVICPRRRMPRSRWAPCAASAKHILASVQRWNWCRASQGIMRRPKASRGRKSNCTSRRSVEVKVQYLQVAHRKARGPLPASLTECYNHGRSHGSWYG